jgi:hypothetical protein
MWSSVGSVGIVDSSDVGKVVFIGSIAQLGVGILPPLAEASVIPPIEERFRIPIATTTATIRYPVQEADLPDQTPNLVVRYRDGAGSVTVQLIQVSVVTGMETPLIGLQSGVGYPRSNNFHNEISQFAFVTDFQQNVYYVAVTLTGPTVVLGIPPAIQLMQLKS